MPATDEIMQFVDHFEANKRAYCTLHLLKQSEIAATDRQIKENRRRGRRREQKKHPLPASPLCKT